MKMSIYTVAFCAVVILNLIVDYQCKEAKDSAKFWKGMYTTSNGNVEHTIELDIRLGKLDAKVDQLLSRPTFIQGPSTPAPFIPYMPSYPLSPNVNVKSMQLPYSTNAL